MAEGMPLMCPSFDCTMALRNTKYHEVVVIVALVSGTIQMVLESARCADVEGETETFQGKKLTQPNMYMRQVKNKKRYNGQHTIAHAMCIYFKEICTDCNISKYSTNVEQLLRDEMRQTVPVCIKASSRPEHSKHVSRH